MALREGASFAKKYRIVRLLEEGGMGAVYEAEQTKVGRPVALKTMRPELVTNAEHRRRFEAEARASSRFESDYVVKVFDHDIDADTGTPWIEMELLRGENLGATVARRGFLTPAEVRAIFEDVAKGLGPAHDVGVIHLDLKPENLFIARLQDRTVVKVLDFGISKIAAEQRKSAQVTTLIASPMFLAPEQARRNGRVTAATDVWALGLIAFYLLTGRFYWRNANLAPGEVFDQGAQLELLLEIGSSPLDPPSARARSLAAPAQPPPGFDAWFSRCVARDLEARFPTAAAAIAALAEALGPLPRVPVPDPGSTTPSRPPAPPAAHAAPPSLPVPATRPTGPPVAPTAPMNPTPPPPPPLAPRAPPALPYATEHVEVAGGRRAERVARPAPRALLGAGVVLAAVTAAVLVLAARASKSPAPATTAAVVAPRRTPVGPVIAPVAPSPPPPRLPSAPPGCDTPQAGESAERFQRRCSSAPPENAFVTVPEGDLAVQEHEVTRGELGRWLRPAPEGAPELPAVNVPRGVAAAYCASLGGARLPTRAEWRLALGRDARWALPVTPERALAAGGSSASDERALGRSGSLYDLVGNVNEWTADGPDDAPYAMGAFFGEARDTVEGYLRDGNIETGPTDHTGFRCVRTIARAAPRRPAVRARPRVPAGGGGDFGDLGL